MRCNARVKNEFQGAPHFGQQDLLGSRFLERGGGGVEEDASKIPTNPFQAGAYVYLEYVLYLILSFTCAFRLPEEFLTKTLREGSSRSEPQLGKAPIQLSLSCLSLHEWVHPFRKASEASDFIQKMEISLACIPKNLVDR